MSELIQRSGLPSAAENTTTSRYRAITVMEKRGYNPVHELIDIAEELRELGNTSEDPLLRKERAAIATTLLKYFSPPQKQEIDMNVQQQHSIVLQPMSYQNDGQVPVCRPRIIDVTPKVLEIE